jgi:hypothetical protein
VVAHLHTNRKVKHANSMILQDLKPHILPRRARMSMLGIALESGSEQLRSR